MTVEGRSAANEDSGFTLVEVLVSLAILSVVAVLIAQAFSGDHRALAAIESRTGQGEEVAWAQGELRTLVEALTPHANFIGGEPVIAFTGAPTSAEWMALVKPPGAGARMERVRVDLSPDGALRVATSSPDGPPRFGPPTSLLRGVHAARFSYFGAPRAGAPPSWRDRWGGTASPPRAIKLELALDGDARRWWPVFIASPAAAIDDACIIDPQTGACRGRS